MQKKEYMGVEIKINVFAGEELFAASDEPQTKFEFDGNQDQNELPIL